MGSAESRSTKGWGNNLSKKGSSRSVVSKPSENRFANLATASLEGVFIVDEQKAPRHTLFVIPRFTSSVAVYFNHIKLNSDLNPFVYDLETKYDAYSPYFSDSHAIHKRQHSSLRLITELGHKISKRDLKTCSQIFNSVGYQRHLKSATKLLHNFVSHAVTGEMRDVEDQLMRLGAMHAELGIPAKDVYSFNESFNHCLEHTIEADRKIIHSWKVLIRYFIYFIVRGMNEHYIKVRYVYWSNIYPGKCSSTCSDRPALTGINPEAWLSLRNMADTVEALQD